jgi:hypothetical protein
VKSTLDWWLIRQTNMTRFNLGYRDGFWVVLVTRSMGYLICTLDGVLGGCGCGMLDDLYL